MAGSTFESVAYVRNSLRNCAVGDAQEMNRIARTPYRTSRTPPAHRQTLELPLGEISRLCLDGVWNRKSAAVVVMLFRGDFGVRIAIFWW